MILDVFSKGFNPIEPTFLITYFLKRTPEIFDSLYKPDRYYNKYRQLHFINSQM